MSTSHNVYLGLDGAPAVGHPVQRPAVELVEAGGEAPHVVVFRHGRDAEGAPPLLERVLAEREEARAVARTLLAALEPFVCLFEAKRERHMQRSAEAVKLGRIWFDEMPDDWIFETQGLTMANFRKARAASAAAAAAGIEVEP